MISNFGNDCNCSHFKCSCFEFEIYCDCIQRGEQIRVSPGRHTNSLTDVNTGSTRSLCSDMFCIRKGCELDSDFTTCSDDDKSYSQTVTDTCRADFALRPTTTGPKINTHLSENPKKMNTIENSPIDNEQNKNDSSDGCRPISKRSGPRIKHGVRPSQERTVSFLHWNIGGITTKLYDNEFVDYVRSFDVISLVETFVEKFESNAFSDFAIFVKSAIKLSRQGRHSGGIICLVRKCFLPLIRKIECTCVNHVSFVIDKRLFGVTKDILYICTYIHPEGSPFYTVFDIDDGITFWEDCITTILMNQTDVDLLVSGDFNARTSNLIPNCFDVENIHNCCDDVGFDKINRHSQDTVLNTYGKKFLHLCSTLGLCMFNGLCNGDLVGRYTYVRDTGSSVNDYFLASWDLFNCILTRCNLFVGDRIESDHMPLSFSVVNAHSDEMSAADAKTYLYIEKFVWNPDFAHTFYANMNSEEAKNVFERVMYMIDVDVNAAIDIFNNFVKLQASPLKKRIIADKKYKSEWFDRECSEERRKVRKTLKNFRKCPTAENRQRYCKMRREYKNLIHHKRKLYNDSLFGKLVSSVDNQQTFWQNMSKLNSSRIQTKNEITITSWYEHFKSVLEKPDDVQPFDDIISDEENMEVFNGPITREEVIYAIGKLKNGKSPGPDELISEFFKYAGDLTVNMLVKLFNKLFDHGIYPKCWMECVIVPLFKKGDVNDTNNYRGISLCNTSSKLYGIIINSRLQSWVTMNNITGEHQAGFKKDYSTMDHIFTLLSVIQKQFVQNRKLYVAFIDLEKAFDSISRKLLWPILLKNGIKGKLYNCFKSMYTEVKAKVRCGVNFTDFISCTKGLKQGDTCSPLLFSIFINELSLEIIQNGKHGANISFELIELFLLLFADDMALIAETVVGLQTQLNNLYAASLRLNLTVNMEKTGIIVCRKGGYLSANERWFYGGERVAVVNNYKYLGIYFSTRLSFGFACQDLISRAKKAVISILKSMHKFQFSSVDVFLKLFDAQVQPIVQYGAEIWGIDKGREIEKVQMFALKKFLFVNSKTPNDFVYGELGRFPLYVNSYVACIRYWLRLITMDSNRLPFKCYKMLYELDNRGKVTWATGVRRCLSSYGFYYVWVNQGVGCTKMFLSSFRQRLIDCRWQEWDSHVQQSDCFSLYRMFKTTYSIESYVYLEVNRYVKNALIKFRCRVSNLNVHVNRFKHSTEEELKCRLCRLDREDEVHFVFCCPCLSDLRCDFIPVKYYQYPSRFKLALLLSSTNMSVLKSLALFLYFAFKRLNEIV